MISVHDFSVHNFFVPFSFHDFRFWIKFFKIFNCFIRLTDYLIFANLNFFVLFLVIPDFRRLFLRTDYP